MPHAYGVRGKTRSLFSKPFRRHGQDPISRSLVNFHVGDFADIIVDGAKHKGMPHKYYHGRTGRVYDVSKRAIGVIINKKVRNRCIEKRLHIRFEHLRKSRCRDAFIKRIQVNDKAKTAANKDKKRISTKRIPAAPETAHLIDLSKTQVEFVNPKPFTYVY